MKIIEVNPNELTIKFYDKSGIMIENGDCGSEFFSDLFSIECDGVDSSKVRKVEFPTLDYENNNIIKVKIYVEE